MSALQVLSEHVPDKTAHKILQHFVFILWTPLCNVCCFVIQESTNMLLLREEMNSKYKTIVFNLCTEILKYLKYVNAAKDNDLKNLANYQLNMYTF